MLSLSDRNMTTLRKFIMVTAILLLVIVAVTKLLGFVAPFIIALILTSIIEDPVRFLQKRLRFPRGLAVAVILFLFVIVVGGLAGFVFHRLFMEVWNLAKDSIAIQNLVSFVENLVERSQVFYFSLPVDITSTIENSFRDFAGTLAGWIGSLADWMLSVIQSLPSVFLYIIISIVATYFLSRDREKIALFVFKQFPSNWVDKMRRVKRDLLLALVGYIKAQLTLISITFILVLTGYTIIGIEYTFFLAVITAFFDLLPVFGPGTVLIPGAVFQLMTGNNGAAVGFIVLYITVLVLRQLLEPRVVGGNIGLHPLVTLIFIYLGFRAFGLMGLILGPVIAIVIKSLQRVNVLPQWKT